MVTPDLEKRWELDFSMKANTLEVRPGQRLKTHWRPCRSHMLSFKTYILLILYILHSH